MSEIEYRVKLSGELNKKEIDDFIRVFNEVFGAEHDRKWFNWKYLDNIYGDSYIVLVYDGEKAIGARSFWRNDIGENIAYQPCDTAVDSDYRGMGIFTKMTLEVLDLVGEKVIYNYPNENSYPGYIKLGWEIKSFYYLKLVMSKKNLAREAQVIDDNYMKWKFVDSPISTYYYTRQNDNYYLLYKRSKKIYYVLGKFSPEFAKNFKEVDSPILFNYTNEKTMMYRLIKNRARIVTYDRENKYEELVIPIYKGDFF